ncbi:MAG TPA: response regulator [Pyrinomonadaceae bacterium]|nr:response regulator [Pyrinomonadaceae bacterium]
MSAQAAVAPAYAGAKQQEYEFEPRLSNGLALVVDDNPDITAMLAAVLRHAGYTVSTAHSAPDALEAALSRHYDLLVSDIGMPGMTGHELARVLRAMPEYRSIPMIAVTGFDMYDDRERSLEAGFSAHLSKPIDPFALKRAISGTWH